MRSSSDFECNGPERGRTDPYNPCLGRPKVRGQFWTGAGRGSPEIEGTMTTLAKLAADLTAHRVTGRELVDECHANIADSTTEGSRAFLTVDPEKAIAAAEFHDRMRGLGAAASPFAGIPVSIKDLFDVTGETTTAGSMVLRDAPAAAEDAPSVARLRAAGFILIGRTNMTEFAFSGLGINPHYGTPLNPFERSIGRISGGSSSGAAVSVTDRMAFAALGTDTGGSCRIPAALCGLVGFKSTARRISLEGVFPLSPSCDSIGTLANSVSCCDSLDTILAGDTHSPSLDIPIDRLRFAIPQSYVFEGMDEAVASSFGAALTGISKSGADVSDIPLVELGELAKINRKGGFAAAESYAIHRSRITTAGDCYDPRVLGRILRGKNQNAADYLDLVRARADFQHRVSAILTSYDAVLMPTVPTIAPALTALQTDEAYSKANLLMLRNPSIANFLDGCAISIPCQPQGEAPVGLTIMSPHGADRRLFAIAKALERIVCPSDNHS